MQDLLMKIHFYEVQEKCAGKVLSASSAVNPYTGRLIMNANEFQVKAHSFADYPEGCVGGFNANRTPYIYPALGLAEEAGEVSGKFAKAVRDCNGKIDAERKEAIKKELGDVMWFVAELCTLLNVSLEEVMQQNIDKLTSRKERNVIHGNGDER